MSRMVYKVPEEYRVISKEELAVRLGMSYSTLATYLSRRKFGRVPVPDGHIGRSPYWYEGTVAEFLGKREGRVREGPV